MADRVLEIVRYSYSKAGFSDAAVRHAFRYLSAVTSVKFLEDEENPDLFRASGETTPTSSRLRVRENSQQGPCTCVRDTAAENGWRIILPYDPIETITEKLTISVKLGPFSEKSDVLLAVDKPILSRAICDLVAALADTGAISRPSDAITVWPGRARFAAAVSHDIDIARRSIPGSLRLLFNPYAPGRFGGLLDSTVAALGLRHNPYDNLNEWINIENKLGLKSTFFIFAGERRHRLDPVYKPKSLSSGMRTLKDSGFEVALHSSIGCYPGTGIPEARSALADASYCDIHGLRPHYLSAFLPEYWKAAAEAGFSYSSSLGFDDRIGFLDGIDLPFVPFSKTENRAIDMVEIPIAIMDCGLIGRLPASSDDVLHRGLDLIDQTGSTGGLLTLDWHQRTLYNRDYPGWAQLLLRLVHHARNKGAYFGKMSELASLVMNRFRESA